MSPRSEIEVLVPDRVPRDRLTAPWASRDSATSAEVALGSRSVPSDTSTGVSPPKICSASASSPPRTIRPEPPLPPLSFGQFLSRCLPPSIGWSAQLAQSRIVDTHAVGGWYGALSFFFSGFFFSYRPDLRGSVRPPACNAEPAASWLPCIFSRKSLASTLPRVVTAASTTMISRSRFRLASMSAITASFL